MRGIQAIIVAMCVFLAVCAAGCGKSRTERAKEETEKGVAILEKTNRENPDPDDVRQAIEHLRSAVALDPNLAKAHCALGTAYRFERNYESALREYGAAIKLDENYYICIHNLAATQLLMKEYDKGERTLLKVMTMAPDYDEVHSSLGQLYAYRNKTEQAIREYETYIKLTKNREGVRQARKEILRLQGGK